MWFVCIVVIGDLEDILAAVYLWTPLARVGFLPQLGEIASWTEVKALRAKNGGRWIEALPLSGFT
jgi:hypothetical protein